MLLVSPNQSALVPRSCVNYDYTAARDDVIEQLVARLNALLTPKMGIIPSTEHHPAEERYRKEQAER